MSLEDASYINQLVPANPEASDQVSYGDEHLRMIKKVVQQSFPSVNMAVNAIHTSNSAPTLNLADGLLWFDTNLNLLKLRYSGGWVTLPISPITAKTVDIDGGTIDGANVGVTTPGTGKFTTLEATGAITGASATVVGAVAGATADFSGAVGIDGNLDVATDKFIVTTAGNTTIAGTLDVNGTITGSLTGNVQGALTGNVLGNLTGDVDGDVEGKLTGDVEGNVEGDLTGNVTGNVTAVTGTSKFNDLTFQAAGSATVSKIDNNTGLGNSHATLPTQKAVKDYVDGQTYGSTTIDGLTDTNITSQVDSQVLTWIGGGTNKWENKDIPSGGSETLAGLTDTEISSPASGQFLKWDGDDWVNAAVPGGVESFAQLDDTAISSVAADEVLKWNGSKWVNTDEIKVDTVEATTSLKIGGGATVTTIDDSDSLGNSDTKIPTQGAVKSYVDTHSGGGGASKLDDLSDVELNGEATDQLLKYNSSNEWVNSDDIKVDTLEVTGALTGNTGAFTGAVTGASFGASGAVTGASAALGAITGSSATLTGAVISTGGASKVNSLVFHQGGSTVYSIDNNTIGSDSPSRLVTQQAVKTYVDAHGTQLDAKGELLAHDSSNEGTLSVGSQYEVLQVDSGSAFGFKWADVGGDSIVNESITAGKIANATITDAKLSTTGVGATASYTSADITVNAQGRITAAANGTGSGSGASGGGSDKIFWQNGQEVTTNYTLPDDINAVTAGPITINSGKTITIPAGGNWVIV